MYKKNYTKFVFASIMIVFVVLCSMSYAYATACTHTETTEVIVDATCTETGKIDLVCVACGDVLESTVLETISHDLSNYEIVPPDEPGEECIQIATCMGCGQRFGKPYVCSHPSSHEVVTVEPTCITTGVKTSFCDECNSPLSYEDIEALGHSMEWNIATYASPYEDGEKTGVCTNCGTTEVEPYQFEIEENSIIIPGVLDKTFVIDSYTEKAVASNDVVYTYPYALGFGKKDPFVIGHSYGTMKCIYDLPIGTPIYIKIKGELEVYEVRVSEFATEVRGGADIIGLDTNTSLGKHFGTKTLHMYTCCSRYYNGRWYDDWYDGSRWIVIAELVDEIK